MPTVRHPRPSSTRRSSRAVGEDEAVPIEEPRAPISSGVCTWLANANHASTGWLPSLMSACVNALQGGPERVPT
jgi:hypothetical protein